MEFLQQLFESTQMPFLSALLLGLMTAISPCPLATNITAVGFISKDIESKKKVFFNGLYYTLGRAITYTGIGIILYFGASEFNFSSVLQEWGEKILGPILIIIGCFMIGLIRINIPGLNITKGLEGKKKKSFLSIILLGVAFALAFCPYSGVLYFGMLIPMTVNSAQGLYLPFVFAVATGIPVIIFAWLIAFGVGSVGKLYNNIKIFEVWFRRIISVVFIVVGLYMTITLFF